MTLISMLAAPQAAPEPSPLTMFLPLVLIFVVFYFFIIRPQKKKEDNRKKMISAVEKGDKVVTIGGVHGLVTQVDDHSILIKVDGDVKLRVNKAAIADIPSRRGSDQPAKQTA